MSLDIEKFSMTRIANQISELPASLLEEISKMIEAELQERLREEEDTDSE